MPRIVFDGALQRDLELATLALGRLDGVSALLPDRALFLYSYVRKEAVLSSQIEGTQSSLSDLLLFEIDEAPGVPLDDVTEVSNYVAALEHGLGRLRDGFPLSNRLLREIHALLLPRNASFVPPPYVKRAMSDLDQFLRADQPLPLLVCAGLAHVQFEMIRPFLGGNGRVGRLLITLFFFATDVLHDPLLYLSAYLERHRTRYHELLDIVRRDGDWEAWLAFFFEGVRDTATSAVSSANAMSELFQVDRMRIEQQGRRAGSALRVHDALKARPIASLAAISGATGLSFPAAASAVELLASMKIVRELTGRRRNRLFVYDELLNRLNDE